MTNNDFKRILDETLKPIKDEQAAFRKKLDEVSNGQEALKTGQEALNQELGGLKNELADLKNTIDSRVLPPLIYIETTIKGYADQYKVNDSNIRRMEKRLETLEDHAGVDVPPELRLEPLPEAA